MWGWVGQLASAFSSTGFQGLVLLSLLIIIALLIRANTKANAQMAKMHDGMIEALNHSSTSHRKVARVLGRIEGVLRMAPEKGEEA